MDPSHPPQTPGNSHRPPLHDLNQARVSRATPQSGGQAAGSPFETPGSKPPSSHPTPSTHGHHHHIRGPAAFKQEPASSPLARSTSSAPSTKQPRPRHQTLPRLPPVPAGCLSCGKGGHSGVSHRCDGCGWASYCSRPCQRRDWRTHKPVCSQIRSQIRSQHHPAPGGAAGPSTPTTPSLPTSLQRTAPSSSRPSAADSSPSSHAPPSSRPSFPRPCDTCGDNKPYLTGCSFCKNFYVCSTQCYKGLVKHYSICSARAEAKRQKQKTPAQPPAVAGAQQTRCEACHTSLDTERQRLSPPPKCSACQVTHYCSTTCQATRSRAWQKDLCTGTQKVQAKSPCSNSRCQRPLSRIAESCRDCSKAHYCSTACYQQHRQQHLGVCLQDKKMDLEQLQSQGKSSVEAAPKTLEAASRALGAGTGIPATASKTKSPCFTCRAWTDAITCPGCLTARYCSKACQASDYRIHSLACKHLGGHSTGSRPPQSVTTRPTMTTRPSRMTMPGGYPEDNFDEDIGWMGAISGQWYDSDDDEPENPLDKIETQQFIRKLLVLPSIDIPAAERLRKPAGLACDLMPHQQVGLTWLTRQEDGDHKGGILADTMGLGKTIQALALILARPPKEAARKTTLIIGPLALLKQWEREIRDKVKTSHKLSTIIYHGQKKKNMTIASLLSYDVVLTTYGTVSHEYSAVYDFNKDKKKKKPKRKRKTEVKRMFMHNAARFHRVILDEAHNIKNRKACVSLATAKIDATHRLCMTGTPLMNNVTEIYGLIRFLRIRPYDNWQYFRTKVDTPLKKSAFNKNQAMQALQTVLRSIMLQRTDKSMIDGKQILNLPELSINSQKAQFDEEQRAYYEALKEKSQLEVNKYIKEGTVMRHYHYILVLLLRLRQCCCHPFLLKDQEIPDEATIDADGMDTLSRKFPRNVKDRVQRESEGGLTCPMCAGRAKNPVLNFSCGHFVCQDCFNVSMSERDFENGQETVPCPEHEETGCTQEMDPSEVVVLSIFLKANREFAPGGRSGQGRGIGDSTKDADEDVSESDGDEADEKGNLKGFVVDEDEDEEEQENEEEYDTAPEDFPSASKRVKPDPEQPQRNIQATPQAPTEAKKAGPVKPEPDAASIKPEPEAANVAFAGSATVQEDIKAEVPESPKSRSRSSSISSDDSMPPADELIRRIFKTAPKPPAPTTPASAPENPGSAKRKRSASPQRPFKVEKGKSKARPKVFNEPKNRSWNSAGREAYLKRIGAEWVSSSKIDRAIELLAQIRQQYPGEKTLVFSQFTSFLDLLEIPIIREGYNYRRYDGSMDSRSREEAVDAFKDDPNIKLMIISLRAGNAGLNLQEATHVVILDPFWNPSIEDQAIGRAHRIGQKRPVTVHRVLVDDTVEDNIIKLQEKKRDLVNEVLNPEAASSLGRLGVSELAGLFGL